MYTKIFIINYYDYLFAFDFNIMKMKVRNALRKIKMTNNDP
jgi:hypothetical protein